MCQLCAISTLARDEQTSVLWLFAFILTHILHFCFRISSINVRACQTQSFVFLAATLNAEITTKIAVMMVTCYMRNSERKKSSISFWAHSHSYCFSIAQLIQFTVASFRFTYAFMRFSLGFRIIASYLQHGTINYVWSLIVSIRKLLNFVLSLPCSAFVLILR